MKQSREGARENLKESVIGVKVFDREPCYDPKSDPIVRVHARRLRQKLDAFYDHAGSVQVTLRIPKGGYVVQFEQPPGDVAATRERGEQTHARASLIVPAKVPRRWRISGGVAVVALLVCVCVGEWLWQSDRVASANGGVQPLISLPGAAQDVRWSPDGKTMAFTWDDGGSRSSHVYVVRDGESVPASVTGSTEPEYRPVWSPDGKSIAFLRKKAAHDYALLIVNTADGTERRIRDVLVYSPALFAPALDWSPDGQWLITSEQPSEAAEPVHLLLVSAHSSKSWVITDPPDGSTGDLEARFSPDSRQIIFRRGGNGDIYLLGLNGTTALPPVALTTQNPGVRGLAFSPDGESVYFGSRQGSGQFGIWRMSLLDRSMARITPADMEAIGPAVDKHGQVVAFTQPDVDVNLWLYNAKDVRSPRLLVPSTRAEYSPSFSPDGQWLAFISDRSGTPEIWVAGVGGAQPRQLTNLGSDGLPMGPSWSPDGKRIVFFCRTRGLNFAYEVEVKSGDTRALTRGDAYALYPQYSADGSQLYYVSNAGSRYRIWMQPVHNAVAAEPVSADTVRYFRMSKDGRYLYFLRGHPEQLIRMDLATREERAVWTLKQSPAAFDGWDVAGQKLFLLGKTPTDAEAELTVTDIGTGETRVLGSVRKLSREWQTGIGVEKDGTAAVVSQVDSDNSRLMYVKLSR